MIEISIIIPVYNVQDYLARSVDAILKNDTEGCEVMQQAAAREEDPEKKASYNSTIAKYKAAYPEKSMLFMKGLQSGSSYTIGGWMGVTITVP